MKTTIELDEVLLGSVMKLTGLKTRKEALDYAIRAGERAAKLKRVLETPMFEGHTGDIIDPKYDLMKIREMDMPRPSAKKRRKSK